QESFRRFRRGKAGEAGLASQRRRIAGGDDRAVAGVDHRGRKPPCQVQQSHGIDLEVTVQNRWIDLPEGAECAANGIVDDDAWIAEIVLHGGSYRLDLRRIGHIASISLGVCKLFLESGKTLLASCKKGYAIATLGKPHGERRTRAGSNAGNKTDRRGHVIKSPR